MNKKLYLENGYLNYNYVFSLAKRNNTPMIIMVGARGVGKTFGALKYMLDNKIKFIYMRRTQTQLDLIRKREYSPFISINEKMGTSIEQFPVTKYSSGIFESELNEKGKIVPVGDLLGLTAALSTFANIRSFDASYIKCMIYDEFIGEAHERPIKEESNAFFNAIETINRNRELTGSDPLYTLMLANSNNISNPYFLSMKLVNIVEKMLKSGREIYFDHQRGIMLMNLNNSPISKLKAQTMLYKLTVGSDFFDMAINNNYTGVCRDAVSQEDLMQYKILYVVGELAIYKHKSKGQYYVSAHISGTPKKIYAANVNGLREFRAKHHSIWMKYCVNKVIFESYTQQILFEKYYKNVI